ncbi:MAG: arylamine N-acetyltransferase [Acidobacteriota bacterium]|nr:arylamine N-acetyltransferase [Acidobacteriota bacterium]
MIVDVDAYLERIGHTGTRAPTLATLCALHRQHMLTVPFENLDIPLGRRITLAPDALWNKIVAGRRGGFCYELNTLFGRLLQTLGYRVDFLSARVWTATDFGPDKDHMALLVDVDGQPWLADVGFGDSFLVPLRLEPGTPQDDGVKAFRLRTDGDRWIVQVQERGRPWNDEYRFELDAHPPEAFQPMCDYQQTSPDSAFTRRAVCSRATARGRVTVTHDRLIVTIGDQLIDSPLRDAAEFRAALATHHQIRLTPDEAATIVARFSRPAE